MGAAYGAVAWLLIQVTQTLFPVFGLGATAVRSVVVVLAIGLLPALIFAWAYEFTPEGLKREGEVDRSQSTTPQTGRKVDRVIMGVLALALGYFAVDKFVLAPQREQAATEAARAEGRTESLVKSYGEKSIAVLPFVDMSPNKDQEYFSDGISEELLNLLAKISELRVISRSSAFSFKGKDIDIPEIAKRLHVTHILEGSVRKSGNKVRITAQLIDARSDTHLWSETYDRDLDDIFAVQDEIAAAAVAQLKITLLGEAPKARATDPEAYALYLQARQLGRQSTAEAFKESDALYRRVLAIDPRYAPAWSGLAGNFTDESAFGVLSSEDSYARAREALKKALAIDPDYAPAHANLGWIAMAGENDLAGAAQHLERAMALDPVDSGVLGNAAGLLLSLGRMDEALALEEAVVRRDPVNVAALFNLGVVQLSAGRVDAAIASYRTVLSLSPGNGGAHYALGVALLLRGDAAGALAEMEQETSEIWRMLGLPMAYHALGRKADSDAALAALIAKYGKDAPSNIAYVYAFRDEADQAFAWLDKAHDTGLAQIAAESLFANIHGDPRWLPFLRKLGMAPEQLAAIKFDVKLPQ